jgi:hypothetical protein
VRFSAVSNRLAWLRRPANGFGWVGDGFVRFLPEGVSIIGRRLTLWGQRRSPHLIRPGEIRDVYREGNAVQINLRHGGRRPFVRFWTEEIADAAELVARLPTTRTIELETPASTPQGAGTLRPELWLLAFGVLVLLALAWLKALQSPAPVALLPAPATPASRPVAGPASDQLQGALDGASPTERYQARADLERFSASFDALTQQFGTAFNALTVAGTLTQQEFADGLEKWLLPQWGALARQWAMLPPQQAPVTTLRARADRELGGVIAAWQRALKLYADGLRAQDSRAVNAAFDGIREAEAHEGRASWLLRRLESTQAQSGR